MNIFKLYTFSLVLLFAAISKTKAQLVTEKTKGIFKHTFWKLASNRNNHFNFFKNKVGNVYTFDMYCSTKDSSWNIHMGE